jgi:aspartyl-tRNA(Asn)/glutamyl-tRNA(Gln) amidotransferase subunit B
LVTPGEVRSQLGGLGLKTSQVEILVNDPTATLSYLKDTGAKVLVKPAEQLLVAKALEQNPDLRAAYAGLDNQQRQSLVKLAQAVDSGSISATMFNHALPDLIAGKDVSTHLSSTQISDSGELDKIVAEVITDNPKAVADYLAGQEQARKFLVGQVMKVTGGQANALMVNDILKTQLDR